MQTATPVLDRLRVKHSRKVVLAVCAIAIGIAGLSIADGHASVELVGASCGALIALAIIANYLRPTSVAVTYFLSACLVLPAAFGAYALSGQSMQAGAVAGLFLGMSFTLGWTDPRCVITSAVTAVGVQVLLFLSASKGLYADAATAAVMVLATIVQAAVLVQIVAMAKRTAKHFEKSMENSAQAQSTIEELAEKQGLLAKRESGRREELQKIITSFDTDLLDSFDTVLQKLSALKTTASNLTEIANRNNGDVQSAATATSSSSQNINSVTGAVEQLASSISAINDELSSTNELAQTIERNLKGTNQAVDSFDISIHRIDDVVGLIQTIASKINLLALNATIEAARAGEAGRGFAVVATEVKNLASQTANATRDVAEQIQEVKNAAAVAFDSARNLSSGVRQMNQRTITIAESVQAQDIATRTIHENMAGVASSVQSMAQLTGNVRRSSEVTLVVANDVFEATDELQSQATGLETSIHKLLQKIASA